MKNYMCIYVLHHTKCCLVHRLSFKHDLYCFEALLKKKNDRLTMHIILFQELVRVAHMCTLLTVNLEYLLRPEYDISASI